MRILGCYYQSGATVSQWRGDLAALLCVILPYPADPSGTTGAFAGGGWVDYRDYGACVCGPVGEGDDYRDGGGLGTCSMG